MLEIKYKNKLYEFEFNGIKVIETLHSTNFIKDIFSNEDQKIRIDGRTVLFKNVIYINELTKLNDFLTLNKNNYIYKSIIENIEDKCLINDKLIDEIINAINDELEIKDLLIKQYDVNKLINAIFALNDLGYVDEEILFNILNKIEYDEKKLIIFDNCKFINYKKCKNLLNKYNILIVCSDIRGIINNHNELELCLFANDNIFEVISIDRLISYLELKMSEPLSLEDINSYLSFDMSRKSSNINFYLKDL